MKSLGLSLVAATLAGLIIGTGYPAAAQSRDELRAGALLQTAERLAEESHDTDAVEAAYERALTAYDDLGDTDQSLGILEDLFNLNYLACRDKVAIDWAKNALARFDRDSPEFDLFANHSDYAHWVTGLATLYESTGQIEQELRVDLRSNHCNRSSFTSSQV
ncbi:MAG: hypothetical protein F6K11_00375 [Leptolyngbya sp. SIO3F4]|nr:hypothetical protein [Leptolyngbya sp. SIO3F4]